jgi:TPR repeat protein
LDTDMRGRFFAVVRVSMVMISMTSGASAQKAPSPADLIKQADDLRMRGGAEDVVKAFRLYEQVAKSGNPDAMLVVGKCLGAGIGAPKDPKKSFEWIE